MSVCKVIAFLFVCLFWFFCIVWSLENTCTSIAELPFQALQLSAVVIGASRCSPGAPDDSHQAEGSLCGVLTAMYVMAKGTPLVHYLGLHLSLPV